MPTLQECVGDLERNKFMRQVVGMLIELEEDEEDRKVASKSPDQEMTEKDDDSVASAGRNETDGCCRYEEASESHYENFISKEPNVSWPDLLRGVDKEGCKVFLKAYFDIVQGSTYSKNETDEQAAAADDDDADDVEASSLPDIPALHEMVYTHALAQF